MLKFALYSIHSDHSIRILPLFHYMHSAPFNDKILPYITFHFYRTTQQSQTKMPSQLLIFSIYAVSSSLLRLPVNNKTSVPYNYCSSPFVLTNTSDNSLLPINTYKCPSYNTKFSRLPLSPTTEVNKQNPKLPALNLHSTFSPASLQVKCTNTSSHQSNDQQQRSPHHTQTYLSLFFSHPHSLPPFVHFQFHSAVAAAYQRISRLQLPHTFIPISLLILPTVDTLSFPYTPPIFIIVTFISCYRI